MSIATEITRLNKAKADIKAAIENKGGTVGTSIDTYAEAIDNLSGGEHKLPFNSPIPTKLASKNRVYAIALPETGSDESAIFTIIANGKTYEIETDYDGDVFDFYKQGDYNNRVDIGYIPYPDDPACGAAINYLTNNDFDYFYTTNNTTIIFPKNRTTMSVQVAFGKIVDSLMYV